MSTPIPAAVSDYYAGLTEEQRSTILVLRDQILQVVPEATEVISYGMPAFKVGKTVVAGLGAFKRHIGYLPHSGQVLPQFAAETAGMTQTISSLHVPLGTRLPDELVRNLVVAKQNLSTR